MKKETTTEIALIKKSIPSTLLSQVQEIKIVDNKSLSLATEKLSQINKYLDSVVAWKEAKTTPLNQALRVIRAETKPFEDMLKSAIEHIRTGMSEYVTNIELEKQKIADRIKAGRGNLSIEKGSEKIAEIAVPQVTETESGSIQFIDKPTLKITNIDRVPRAFMVVDERKLFDALKRGDKIEGAEIVIIKIPRNNRN